MSLKMQRIKVKIKASWGPLKVWGPWGSIPPLSGPEHEPYFKWSVLLLATAYLLMLVIMCAIL